MATAKGPLLFTGSLDFLSYYTRRGSDKVYIRTKGGASKDKIKNSPKFEGLRMQQKEWKGCTAFASVLRYAFGGLHRLADYNITPVLNGLAKELQKTDTTHTVGQRGIYLSNFKHSIENFQLNRQYPFNTVLRVLPVASIYRESGKASVTFPRICPGTDIHNLQKLPFFRLIVSLGIISDLAIYHTEFLPLVPELHGTCEIHTGAWYNTSGVVEEQTVELVFDAQKLAKLNDSCTLILSIGIEFGKLNMLNQTEAVKYAGCARVLKVG